MPVEHHAFKAKVRRMNLYARLAEFAKRAGFKVRMTPMCKSGAGFADPISRLERAGFRCIGLVQGFANNRTHELLQVDGLFVRG